MYAGRAPCRSAQRFKYAAAASWEAEWEKLAAAPYLHILPESGEYQVDFSSRPETAVPLYERFLAGARQAGVPTECGEFGADMLVSLENDGPVTILLDTDEIMPGKRARRE